MDENSAWAISAGFARVVPPKAFIKGTLSANKPQLVLVEGTFSGSMLLPGSTVLIAAAADVEAALIEAGRVVVCDRLKGVVRSGEIEIRTTGSVAGSLHYATSLIVTAGALLQASINGPAPAIDLLASSVSHA